jgi:hypothetical protein
VTGRGVPGLEALRAQVHRAFDNVEIPTRVEQMRLPKYTGDDSYEMAAALVGRKWDAIPIEVLFYHRESLATLSPLAFHAYLPAYLLACLASDDPFDKHGADIRGYLLFALGSWPHQSDPDRPAETRERLSLLDSKQRDVVANVLRYLESRWNMKDAGELLRNWRAS